MEQPLAVYSTGLFDVSGRNPGTELVVHLNLNKRDPVVLFAFQERLNGADEDRLVAVAEAALRGNWTLLDGVERRFGR